MPGGNVAYQLRPNKFVERQLFVELLLRLEKIKSLTGYAYVSLGGRFLEDFRVVHRRLGIHRLLSIEIDKSISDRQRFNRPIGVVECVHAGSSDFIGEFEFYSENFENPSFVVWLDYAAANERQVQLQEYEALVSKLSAFDVVKITLNANLTNLMGGQQRRDYKKAQQLALQRINEELGDYFPGRNVVADEMTEEGFALVLAESVKKAALKGIQGSKGLTIRPLAIYRYRDGQQMLTVTALVLEAAHWEEALVKLQLPEWGYATDGWSTVREIFVPDLSLKEQLHIQEQLLATTNDQLHTSLPFRLDSDDERSLELFQHYVEHYRRYPSFVHIDI